MKYSLPKIKPIKANKTVVTVFAVAAVVIIMAVLIAAYQIHRNDARDAAEAKATRDHKSALQVQNEVAGLTKRATTAEAKNAHLCAYVADKARTKPTAGFIVVPAADCQ